jgi:hypothetical protein
MAFFLFKLESSHFLAERLGSCQSNHFTAAGDKEAQPEK